MMAANKNDNISAYLKTLLWRLSGRGYAIEKSSQFLLLFRPLTSRILVGIVF